MVGVEVLHKANGSIRIFPLGERKYNYIDPEDAVKRIATVVLNATFDKDNLPNVSSKVGAFLEKVFKMLHKDFPTLIYTS